MNDFLSERQETVNIFTPGHCACFLMFRSAYEDEDLQDIRASMERLLQEEDDLIRNSPGFTAGDFNGNPPEVQELFSRLAAEIDQDNNQMAVDDEDDNNEDEEGAEGDEEEEEDEEEDEEEEEEECSNGSPGDEEHSNNGHLNEEWHSGMRSVLWCTHDS